ncbi:MAG: ABC transporter permease [Nitrososphaerota archaeon]|nr:ABC transporter permease [Nitrososphaerota archaeon]
MNIRIPNSVRLAWRNLKVNMDPGSLTVIIGLPAMYLIFMGTMFASIISNFQVGGVVYNYVSYLAPGIIAFQTVMAGTIGGSMLWLDRRFGMFSQILSGPFTRSQYLMGIIFATSTASLVGAGLMIAISLGIGGAIYASALGLALVFLNLIVGAIFFCSLMLYIAAKVRSNQMYNSIQILILFVINFVSSVFYPLTKSTPSILFYASYINPLTYISDGIRSGLGHPSLILSSWNPVETVVLLVETVVMFVFAYRTYTSVHVGRA